MRFPELLLLLTLSTVLPCCVPQGLRLAEKVSAVLKALSFAFGAGAAGLWAVALAPGGPGLKVAAAAVAATFLAGAAAVARQKVRLARQTG